MGKKQFFFNCRSSNNLECIGRPFSCLERFKKMLVLFKLINKSITSDQKLKICDATIMKNVKYRNGKDLVMKQGKYKDY